MSWSDFGGYAGLIFITYIFIDALLVKYLNWKVHNRK